MSISTKKYNFLYLKQASQVLADVKHHTELKKTWKLSRTWHHSHCYKQLQTSLADVHTLTILSETQIVLWDFNIVKEGSILAIVVAIVAITIVKLQLDKGVPPVALIG